MNRDLRDLRTFASAILSVGICCNPMPGQGPVIMTIDTQNVVDTRQTVVPGVCDFVPKNSGG